jgi:hypothetical protein
MSELDISASNVKTRFASHSTLQFKDIKDPCTALTARGVTKPCKEA